MAMSLVHLPPPQPINIIFLASVRRLRGGYLAPSFFFASDPAFSRKNLGNPGLDKRIFTEDELRRSEQQRRGKRKGRAGGTAA
jgi:hypothetical protein